MQAGSRTSVCVIVMLLGGGSAASALDPDNDPAHPWGTAVNGLCCQRMAQQRAGQTVAIAGIVNPQEGMCDGRIWS
jgi:hypothetical protein